MIYINDYEKEILEFAKDLDLEFLRNKTVLMSGGTGLIGSYFIDTLMAKDINIKIYCIARNVNNAEKRFYKYKNNQNLVFVQGDLTNHFDFNEEVDYIFHLASFSDPKNYATYPVETMMMNILGCKSLLDVAKKCKCKRFFCASSVEIYGATDEPMVETNCGSVDITDVRSCYNEAKRASESLSISYNHQYGVDCVIGRLCRIFGPTMLMQDTKAFSQFLKNTLNGEDIVLKSLGNQVFSYLYVQDAVSGIVKVVKDGVTANAYNISNDTGLKSLKEIAENMSSLSGTKVIFKLPNENEKVGYSRAVKAVLPIDKIKELGWEPKVSLDEGIKRTYNILKQVYICNGEKEKHY